MSFFGRLFNRPNRPAPVPSVSVLPVTAGAREYLFWLNDSLTVLAETMQEIHSLIPVLSAASVRIQNTDERLPLEESRRLTNALTRLRHLHDEADAYMPAQDYANALELDSWQHAMYVELLTRHLSALLSLIDGYGGGDQESVIGAQLALIEASTPTGDLHEIVIGRIIATLPPEQQREARQRLSSIGTGEQDRRGRSAYESRPPDDLYDGGQ